MIDDNELMVKPEEVDFLDPVTVHVLLDVMHDSYDDHVEIISDYGFPEVFKNLIYYVTATAINNLLRHKENFDNYEGFTSNESLREIVNSVSFDNAIYDDSNGFVGGLDELLKANDYNLEKDKETIIDFIVGRAKKSIDSCVGYALSQEPDPKLDGEALVLFCNAVDDISRYNEHRDTALPKVFYIVGRKFFKDEVVSRIIHNKAFDDYENMIRETIRERCFFDDCGYGELINLSRGTIGSFEQLLRAYGLDSEKDKEMVITILADWMITVVRQAMSETFDKQ